MDKKNMIDEEILENVSGGVERVVSDDPQSAGRCKKCSALLRKTEYGYFCPDCNTMYDRNKRVIDGDKRAW